MPSSDQLKLDGGQQPLQRLSTMLSNTSYLRLKKLEKLEMILKGVYINDDTYLTTNTTIMKATQNFILATKRFESAG